MTNPIPSYIPDYKNLDQSGEILQTAIRLESRARENASQEMFDWLVTPLLTDKVRHVLEFGCGTAALSRRIAGAAPVSKVCASDKSVGMLEIAAEIIRTEGLSNIELKPWDVLDQASFPFRRQHFDLIISSVVVPYMDDTQTLALLPRLVSHLAPAGILAFLEQDLNTDSLHYPDISLVRRIMQKEGRQVKPTSSIGLRPFLRQAGLSLLPRRSFLWSDDAYGAYTRELLERFADNAYGHKTITEKERDQWKRTLDEFANEGDFYYGLVYHLVAGRLKL